MRNDEYWDQCHNNTIRKKIAEFISTTKHLSSFIGKKFFELEDAFVSFIEQNRNFISKEVDLEFHREDVVHQIKDTFGNASEFILKALPVSALDNIVSHWQDGLSDNDNFWEENWNSLNDVLTDSGLCPMFINLSYYSTKDIKTYSAYLKEWYSDEESDGDCLPLKIDEFFDCETTNEELLQYYEKRADQLFTKREK